MEGKVVSLSLLLLLSGTVRADDFCEEAPPVGNAAGSSTKNYPPVISHRPLPPQQRDERITVEATVVGDPTGVVIKLYYRQGGGIDFTDESMSGSGNLFIGTIPASQVRSRGVEYFFEATDGAGTTRLPVSGIFCIQIEIGRPEKQTAQPHGRAQNAYRLL